MKNRILSLALALTLCLALAAPARAYDMGKAGEYTILSCGGMHTAAIDANGGLWTWGYNDHGELGDGTTTDRSTPVKVLDNVAAVSCGYGHTAAIKTDGSLWTWGYNANGELGDGTTTHRSTPVKVLDNVAAVSCGGVHTAVIKTDGSLWTWGDNANGELGDGTTTHRSTPVKVLDNVAAVSCGTFHTAAIRTDGSLWTCGRNDKGQLGDGTTTDRSTPVKVLDNVAAVSCGENYTAAVKTDGSLWTWGDNYWGYLGDGTTTERHTPVKVLDNVAAVSCGLYHTAAIKTDGSLWTWGDNGSGELGSGKSTDQLYKKPGKVLDSVAAVSCGNYHTTAVKTDGSLWTWGGNYYGQLGYAGGNKKDVAGDSIQTVPKQVTGVTAPRGVQLYLNGGTGGGVLWTSADGTVKVPTNPTRNGYSFGGWYTDAALTQPWNFNGQVVNGLVLYAKWIPLSSTAATTNERSTAITLNGAKKTLQTYVLKADSNGGDINYVKLRDVAALLDGTGSQCNVDWRNKTIYIENGKPYTTRNGTELKPITGAGNTYKLNRAPILFDGVTAPLEGIVLTDGNGGGHTFFKLRDLGEAIGFTVDWNASDGVIIKTK